MSGFQPIGALAARVVAEAGRKAFPPPTGVETHPKADHAAWMALRSKDITASVIGALMGVHEYQTAFGLYLEKTGALTPEADDRPVLSADGEEIVIPPLLRGQLFEPAALAALAVKHPDWRVVPANDAYWRHPEWRIGATPDAFAVDPARKGRGVIQVKTTSDLIFRQRWHDADGTVQIPLWIACQAITEARLTGSSWAAVALLVVGMSTRLRVIDVPLHEGLWTRMRAEVATFWQRVAEQRAPEPDYARDAELVTGMYRGDDGTEIDLTGDNRMVEIVAERAKLKAVEKAGTEAEKQRKALDAEIIAKLGNAQRARLANGSVVSAKSVTVNRKPSPATTYQYRRITVAGTPQTQEQDQGEAA